VNDGVMNWQVLPTISKSPLLSVTQLSLQVAIVPYDVFHYKRFKYQRRLRELKSIFETNGMIKSNHSPREISIKQFMQQRIFTPHRAHSMDGMEFRTAFNLSRPPNDLQTADSLALLQVGDYAMNLQASSFPISKKYFALGAGKRRWLRETTRAFRVFYEESKHYCQIFTSPRESQE